MSRREFILTSLGHDRKMALEAEMHRMTAYMVYAVAPKEKGKMNMSMHKFWPLPTDFENMLPMRSEEEIRAERAMFIEIRNVKFEKVKRVRG